MRLSKRAPEAAADQAAAELAAREQELAAQGEELARREAELVRTRGRRTSRRGPARTRCEAGAGRQGAPAAAKPTLPRRLHPLSAPPPPVTVAAGTQLA